MKTQYTGMDVNLLIPNLGSTSLKYQILEMPSETVLAKGRVERVTNYREAMAGISTGSVAGGTAIHGVALKAVHGGPKYRGTFVVDEGVVEALRQFLPEGQRTSRSFVWEHHDNSVQFWTPASQLSVIT